MADKSTEGTFKKWSLAEIDELLNDSVSTGVAADGESVSVDEKTRPFSIIREDYVDPRPTHRDGIEHQIKTGHIEHSDVRGASATGAEPYRERYMNKPERNLEKTAEHVIVSGAAIEKPGVVKRKSNISATQDLEPVPTIVSADSVFDNDNGKTRIVDIGTVEPPVQTEAEPDEQLNQIRIDGFDETEEPVIKVDEEQVENELKIRRDAEVKRFFEESGRLPADTEHDGDGEITGEENSEADIPEKPKVKRSRTNKNNTSPELEYRFLGDESKYIYSLARAVKKTSVLLIAEITSFVLVSILAFLPVNYSGIYTFDMFGGSERVFILAELLCSAIAFGVSFKRISAGVKSIISRTPDTNSALSLIWLAAFIQVIAFIVFPGNVLTVAPLYLGVAVVASVLGEAGELVNLKRMQDNFSFISACKTLCTVDSIDGEHEAFEIGRGLLLGEPDIKTSFSVRFPEGVGRLSKSFFPSELLAKKMIPVICSVAVVAAVITGLISKSVASGICSFSAIITIGMPVSAFFTDNLLLRAVSRRLRSKGGVITGYESSEHALCANAVAVDASELFKTGDCNIHGIKMFNSIRPEDVILYTAAMTIEAGSPLTGVFETVIDGDHRLLPPVETLVYEDKLGLSAWIHNRRVLVGNRELLNNHNVATPDKEFEKRYRHNGKCPLYLAVEGKIAAMFLVSYEPDLGAAAVLRTLEKHGLTLLVKTSDANITEDMVCESLSLPHSGTKVLGAVAGDMFSECRRVTRESAPAYLLHDGNTRSMLLALYTAFNLADFKTITSILQVAGAAIGAAVISILSFTSGLYQASAIKIVIFQLFWVLLSAFILKLKKK